MSAFRPICCPDISKGRIPLPSSNEMGYPVANQQLHRGYIQSWNFIIEHKLPARLPDVGRIRRDGIGERLRVPGYQCFADSRARGNAGRPLYPKFGRTATTREFDGRTHSTYHSLQATINRRITGGLFLKGAYTYSHAIDMANYGDWTAFSWNAASVFYRNRASAANNIPHMFQLGYVYELPFGASKKWANSGVAKAVLGDWQFNGVFSAYQGRQYTLSASGAALNMPGNAQTPDQVKPNVATLGQVGDDGTWFDTTAFARPTGVRFGTVGRNTMRGPGVVNVDLSLFRTFKLTERFNLQFRGGVVQPEQHAALRQPERERQQLELRQDHRDAVGRGCDRPLAGAAFRPASGLLTRVTGRAFRQAAKRPACELL